MTVSMTTIAEELLLNENYSVYPNPFNNKTTINVSDNLVIAGLDFILNDVLGREIREIKITSPKTELEKGNLKSGIYFYQLRCREGVVGKGKLVVE